MAFYIFACQKHNYMGKFKSLIKSVVSWIADDGITHIAVSALLVVALGWIDPLWVVPFIALAIGVGKEIYDKYTGGYPTWHDVICDAIGVVLGTAIALLFRIQ